MTSFALPQNNDKYDSSRIHYHSTRGGVVGLTFIDAVLSGLPQDGGLFVPDKIPLVDEDEQKVWSNCSYRDLCFNIMRKFITESEITDYNLRTIIHKAYEQFRKPNCVEIQTLPVVNNDISKRNFIYLMELFHGPTYAFKDFALQFLGQLFGYILKTTKRKVSILGATSGDTGSSAIAGFRGIANINCVILYPHGKTSRIQELQMTTILDDNIQCLALTDSTFDDCQSIVKEIFASPLKSELHLSAVNSINWARILAQIVYYWYACFEIRKMEESNQNNIVSRDFLDICVPTGNFGNILAAYYAKQMGAPINRLIIASNSNDILTRFHRSGKYQLKEVISTSSPSMDIQISSNFERFLFDILHKDAKLVKQNFDCDLRINHEFTVELLALQKVHSIFSAYSANQEETAEMIRTIYRKTNGAVILDPHTAVGLHCAQQYLDEIRSGIPLLVVSTAHFGKFPESLKKILGTEIIDSATPAELKQLEGLPQKLKLIPTSVEAIKSFLVDFCKS